MAKRYILSTPASGEHAAHGLDCRDGEIMQGLVTAGALVALADGEVKTVERNELVNFMDRQGFVATIAPADIAEAFSNRVRELAGRQCANVVLQTLRPLTDRSLASVVVRTAQRVAAADREIHPGELQALGLLRRIMIDLPTVSPAIGAATDVAPRNAMECTHCGAVLISSAWLASAASPGNVVVEQCPICGHDLATAENRMRQKLPDELVELFLPSLVVA